MMRLLRLHTIVLVLPFGHIVVFLPHLVGHLHTFVIIISSYAARGCIGVVPSGTLVATCGCGDLVGEGLSIAWVLIVFLVE